MALTRDPKVIIADEPTTALDVTIQAQIMELMKSLQVNDHKSIILITHNMGVVAEVCDEVVVMYCGRVVEKGDVKELFAHPSHPYTIGLLNSIPKLGEAVEELEAMSPEERFAFWQGELSRCIRCNACRNACPACSCLKCVFDSNKFDSAQKANVDSFEEKMFHIIRAFHVAGRCTDCGECSRVCPQGIPLHLFNRKFIKDINEFYGDFQAGEDTEQEGRSRTSRLMMWSRVSWEKGDNVCIR